MSAAPEASDAPTDSRPQFSRAAALGRASSIDMSSFMAAPALARCHGQGG